MTPDEISETHHMIFENIKQTDSDGNEFWSARQILRVLEYGEYRNFLPVIEKAKISCENSGQKASDHFVETHEMIKLGKGGIRKVNSYALSRYACYLIVQNGDPSKSVIAKGQTYFAIQTRRQELSDEGNFSALSEDERRLMLRKEMKEHNKSLSAAAKDSGVETPIDYAIFQDHGYRGLYGGLKAKEIHKRKGLKKSHQILDHMNSTELAANLFRATQTEEKLRRDEIQEKSTANRTHYEVGSKVRQTIQELGGTMPEELPKPEKSIKQLETSKKKLALKK